MKQRVGLLASLAATGAVIAALLGALLGGPSDGGVASELIASDQGTVLEPAQVPSGFVLVDEALISPEGVSATMATRKYLRTLPKRGAITVRTVNGYTLDPAAEAATAGVTRMTVRGKDAFFIDTGDDSGPGLLLLKWQESEGVVVIVSARGAVTQDEVVAVAKGLS